MLETNGEKMVSEKKRYMESISELEDRTIKIAQSEQRENTLGENKTNKQKTDSKEPVR